MKTTLSNTVIVDDDRISALADGELRGEAFTQALASCERDPALLARWHDYHLIGDVLRSPDLLATRSVSPFLTRLQSRLAHEALQPVAQTGDSPLTPAALPVPLHAAANDAVFRWKVLASVASMAAVAVMVWTLALPTSSTGSQLAQIPASTDAVVVASPQGAMLRDAQLEELLAAHKQVGGNSALQMPSGFLRNATFQTSSNVSNARR
ncbi:MAG: sigma-E factor negative regulatory protein [Polaromonas sp.]|jgi:sigma-E factor negative regulatory protein RseA|nr:sigma-E factor negative regulatory protein [Polaromonas sp.]